MDPFSETLSPSRAAEYAFPMHQPRCCNYLAIKNRKRKCTDFIVQMSECEHEMGQDAMRVKENKRYLLAPPIRAQPQSIDNGHQR